MLEFSDLLRVHHFAFFLLPMTREQTIYNTTPLGVKMELKRTSTEFSTFRGFSPADPYVAGGSWFLAAEGSEPLLPAG